MRFGEFVLVSLVVTKVHAFKAASILTFYQTEFVLVAGEHLRSLHTDFAGNMSSH